MALELAKKRFSEDEQKAQGLKAQCRLLRDHRSRIQAKTVCRPAGASF